MEKRRIPIKPVPFADLEAALEADDYRGFCLACGAEAYGVEPDARRYECESCDVKAVFGAEEIMLMGAYV